MKKYFSKNAVCDECGVKKSDFKTVKLFQKHFQDHFDLQLSCSECPKNFATKLKIECFVTCLENLQLLHEGVSGVKVDPNYI